MLKKTTLLILLVLPLLASASTLYRCIDELNHATYTNYKGSNRKCTVLSRDDSPSRPSSASKSTATKSNTVSASSTTPADFPRVSALAQKNRDGDRHYILDQELATENKNLDAARRSLADKLSTSAAGGSQPEQLQPFRDRIALHERNVEALRREISNLK